MIEQQAGQIVWFQFASLLKHQDMVTHGVFGRHGGASLGPFSSLNAGPATPDDPDARLENYRRIRHALPGHPLLVGTRPLQGTTVYEVTEEDLGARIPPAVILPGGCDAFITQVRGIAVFWAVADCTVVLLLDRAHRAIGLTHAGWRGTRGAILRNTIEAMGARYGTIPSELTVAIGPTIGPCCYEVNEDVRRAFEDDAFARRNARFEVRTAASDDGSESRSLRLDLVASNHAQLVELGVPSAQIEETDLCPGTRTDLFFSHRMEGGQTGRFAVAFGLLDTEE